MTENIPRQRWREFLAAFNRSHEDWLVTVEDIPPDGPRTVVVHDRPLAGVTEDRHGMVIALVGDSEHTDRIIDHPTALRVSRTPDGVERGLEIESASGELVRLRFRSAVRPELVDGI